MINDIQPGYQIHFTSWENDADSYKTLIWSGIKSAEDVKFLLALAKKFTSKNGFERGLGNGSVPADRLIAAVESAMAQVPGISDDMRAMFDGEREEDQDDEDLADRWYDLIAEQILGYPVEQIYLDEAWFCRVFSYAQVYYFDRQVPDISSQFI